jgi:Tetratricopeptide repeat
VAATWTVNHRGDVARRHNDGAEARRLYQRAVERFTSLGDLWGIARSSSDLAYVACDDGDHAAAHDLFAGALLALERLDHKRGIARVFDGFAYLAQREGKSDRALTLAAAAAAVRRTFGAPARPADEAVLEQSLHGARNAYDRATAEAIWTGGQRLTLEDAVTLALDRPAGVTTRS